MNNEPVAWVSPSNQLYKSRMEAVTNGEQMITPLYPHPANVTYELTMDLCRQQAAEIDSLKDRLMLAQQSLDIIDGWTKK